MPNYNKVILAGHLTRDIEIKHISGDTAVGNVGLAVSRKFRTKSGENREEVCFVDCEAWGRTAEVMAQYLTKGSAVLIDGRLKLDTWQDKDGGNRSKLKVVIESFNFVGGKDTGQSRSPKPRAAASVEAEEINEDDIPF